MLIKKMFPCLPAACLILIVLTVTASAQSANSLPTQATTTSTQANGTTRLESDPIIISLAEPTRQNSLGASAPHAAVTFDQLLTAAIDQRLGAPYVFGSSGPNVFDCSGFVWSAFQSVGIRFDRGSARSLWSRFTPARGDERYKFGTLVFFNGLTHVGIVADEHGFYHASRSHGVVYSPFNDYWASRIDGFRRIPMPTPLIAE
jgi:cell wall-associated NlpC family hydrolase